MRPRILRRIAGMAWREAPGGVLRATAASLGAALATLVLPQQFKIAVNQVSGLLTAVAAARRAHAPLSQLATLVDSAQHAILISALLIIGANALRGVLTGYSGYEAERVSQKVAYRMRLDFFQHLQRLPFGFHDAIHSGDLITRGMLDLEGARGFVQQGLLQCVTMIFLLGAIAGMMIAADPVMAAIGLSFVPVAGWSLARMGFLLRVTWMRVQVLMSILTRVMEENLQGVRVVRAFTAKAFEMAKFDKAASEALAYAYKRIVLRFRAISVMQLSYYAAMAGLLWHGGREVAAGRMDPGRLVEFITYLMLLMAPIRQIAMIFLAAARGSTCGFRLFEILDLEPAIADRPGARPLAPTRGVLRFEHVDFAYAEGRPILNDISFEVAPGRALGIVGAPGSGKSTLANLIPRFYDVTAGAITIDGVDIRDVTLASLREYVGLVQQEAFLFDATVTNNIAYADPWAEEARIVGAARTAQIHDYVASLPAAYGTRVGERGVSLSGGQRQRMAIARGVAPRPGIMIFDDSTAAIDAVTERRVRDALAQATARQATIIIAHRLSSLMHADEIIVLDEGRIVERGSHAQLVALGGEYADLFALQSRTAQGLSIADAHIRRRVRETAP